MREWQFPKLIVIRSEKVVNFSVILREIAQIMWIGCEREIHNIELKLNVIPWTKENYFFMWIFCGHEFTDI